MATTLHTNLDAVNDLIFGRWKSRILYTGVALGIFDELAAGKASGGATADELAAQLQINPGAGYRLLRALASIGLLDELPGARFRLTSQGRLLCAGHPSNLRAVALLQDGPEHLVIWKHLPEMIRAGWQNGFRKEFGRTAFEHADANPAYSAVFDSAMASYSAQQAAAAVEALGDFDFAGVQSVVDVGGGRGTLLDALLRAHPALRGVVLERPSVIAAAANANAGATRQGRWSHQAGDMFQSVPPAELYLLKLILHDWNDEHCVRLLENIRRAAMESGRTGARLVILEFVITAPDVPHFSKLYDIHMMCWGEGRERSIPEYEALLRRAGWELGKFRPMPLVEMGIIEARAR